MADWIIDLGPEGGYKGGEIIATGTPEQVAGISGSFTGKYIRRRLDNNKLTKKSVEPHYQRLLSLP